MTCYNLDCKEYNKCDNWKQATCIDKMSKSMYNMRQRLVKEYKYKCFKCGYTFEKGKLKKSRTNILFCPRCKTRVKV